jgi:hypothetical protein
MNALGPPWFGTYWSGPLTGLTIVIFWFIYSGGHKLNKSTSNVGGELLVEDGLDYIV